MLRCCSRAHVGVVVAIGLLTGAATASASSIGDVMWWKPEGTGAGKFLQAPASGATTLVASGYREFICGGGEWTNALVTVTSSTVGAALSGRDQATSDNNCAAGNAEIGLRGGVTWNDVVFSSPGGTGGTANVTLNLLWTALVGSGFDWSIALVAGTGPLASNPAETSVGGGTGPINIIDQLFTTGAINVPLDVPISFHIGLESDWAGAHAFVDLASADLLVELRSFDIFNLPAGVATVNSPSAGIVDNQLAPIPEPAAGTLVALGLLGLGISRRRLRPGLLAR